FHPALSRYAERMLTRRGVDVRTGVLVQKATPGSVALSTVEVVEAQTIVWSAGVIPSIPEIRPQPPLSRSRRIEVDERLRVRGTDGVFAIGDIAAAVGRDGKELPMLSPVAIQAVRYVADAILEGGAAGKPFRCIDKGTMA